VVHQLGSLPPHPVKQTRSLLPLVIGILILGTSYLASHLLLPDLSSQEDNYVNVYNWYGAIPSELLKEFEAETGIKVRYDLFDNNEIVEAKLFSGNSGYDVIFPSASPYVIRQIQAGIYQPIDKSLLPNFKYVDERVNGKMRFADPGLDFSIAYYWGTFGFIYVEEEILKRMPDAPVDSYQMLFDPKVVSRFSDCGVTLLDEAVDVYPAMLSYLGLDPQSDRKEDLDQAQKHLLAIRPSIKRFSSTRFVNEVVSGESCLAQAWSGEAQAAQERAIEVGRKVRIRYTVPKEGGTLWIDAIVIPKNAPHVKNAYRFINFLLRPDVSARITNATHLATANVEALKHIKNDIKNDPTIYPPPHLLERLSLDRSHHMDYERRRTRYWTQFRSGKN
jgi:putrescine transport system substrate-binding protein